MGEGSSGSGGGSFYGGGDGKGGGGDGSGGEGASSVTTTVASSVTATSGLDSTGAPSIADRLSNGSLPAASAFAVRADASDAVLTISSARFTLAAVTCNLE